MSLRRHVTIMPLQDDLILLSYTSAVGPLSAVERQRRYRERTNADEARRAQSLAKGRQRWRERVESGKVKSINSITEKEKRYRRKKWAGAKKRYVHIILLPSPGKWPWKSLIKKKFKL